VTVSLSVELLGSAKDPTKNMVGWSFE